MKRFPIRMIALFAASLLLLPPEATARQASFGGRADRPAHRPAVPGPNGLVTAGHPLASIAGLRTLMAGGNAADAAVATLATLNIVRPQMSGMAGNGFVTLYDRVSDRVYSLGATGAAPLAIDPASRTADELNKGIHAGVVPGLFGGWIALLDRFGTMSLAQVLAPAIDYAENGHPIEASVVAAIESHRELFESFPSSRRMFLPRGRVPEPGETFRMPDLANTLRKVVEAEQAALAAGRTRSEALQAAFDRFYRGDIAEEMAQFYAENGGDFTTEDFARYEPIWAEPIHTTYRGYDIYTSPPTSRGGLEVTMQLNLVEGFDLRALGAGSAETIHLLSEAIKVAKADVYTYAADPALVDVPLDALLSKEYAAVRRSLIDPSRVMAYPGAGNPVQVDEFQSAAALESDARARGEAAGATAAPLRRGHLAEQAQAGSTTSFSIADRFGNVVAATPTHGGAFGTGVVVGNTGLTFNNGSRIGSTSPYPDHVNYVRGGQIPILNNSPIIVLREGRFHAALGTPGGETIGQTQFQVLVNLLDFGMPIQEAIATPRFTLSGEPNFYRPGAEIRFRLEDRLPEDVKATLEGLGYTVELAPGYAFGSIQGITYDAATGALMAGADPRRVAYAVGW
ncbi:MAG: gamma-glutamyltransferase family protein [Gemmatimonadota bacterium]|uniref:gamma-glutamyltransferase family protein n=1 Tax=Candidatus Palauibacter scopulicola TaxID=3056741 RepID=UPI0023947CD4|nr:gamma-glutamyltransferase family protein [Candidatus Palauibacter scopulicola]MDE2662193.1 gamma-glutamyltransferase family protein [Candidatus Palauibacter scopulicola]